MQKFLKVGGLYLVSQYQLKSRQSNTVYLKEIPRTESAPLRSAPNDYTLRTREDFISDLESTSEFDILIIGGGATGVGTLLACSRKGIKAALIESNDFASATSSKSTKLLHGGVRYLERVFRFRNKNRWLDYELVKEALAERNLMLNNVPYMTNQVALVIPSTNIFKNLYYYIGCKLYHYLCKKNKDTR